MEAFFRDGTLRIGTLLDYQREEEHGGLVGDRAEGILPLNGVLTNDILKKSPFLSTGITFAAAHVEVEFEDCALQSPDLYVFSCSRAYSDDALNQWARDPHAGYDACYEIIHPNNFFRAIARAIRDKATFLGVGPVYYYEDEGELRLGSEFATLHPAQLKAGKRYGNQAEIRGFWDPIGEASPFLVQVPKARAWCARYATLNRSKSLETGGSANDQTGSR